jgi:hypothetical protein
VEAIEWFGVSSSTKIIVPGRIMNAAFACAPLPAGAPLKDTVASWMDSAAARDAVAARHGHVRFWDVSQVQDFSDAFGGTDPTRRTFNEDISGWDTSSATSMKQMFNGNSYFDQSLAGWNTGGC